MTNIETPTNPPAVPATGSGFKRITWREAEALLGGRVNRRKMYWHCDDPEMMEYLMGGPVFEYSEWTESCSGCRETEDGHNVGSYPWDAKAQCYVGSGCSECGFTGKRRNGFHSPAIVIQNTDYPESFPDSTPQTGKAGGV